MIKKTLIIIGFLFLSFCTFKSDFGEKSEYRLDQKGFYELKHPDPIFFAHYFDSRDPRTLIYAQYDRLRLEFYDLRLKEMVTLYSLKILNEKFKLKYLGTDLELIPKQGDKNER
jgi:hypothetical protein